MATIDAPRLVRGVGINDADYPVTINAVINGRRRQIWMCPLYGVWADMLRRCYSAKLHDRRPTYSGCEVVPEWHLFSVFLSWASTRHREGMELDKDLLSPGNKVYSPSTCAFISPQINTFIVSRISSRGNWPIGVHWDKSIGKFKAQCRNPITDKQDYLGLFDDPAAAHEAWRSRKHEHACTYADQQTDPRIAQALRTRYSQTEA